MLLTGLSSITASGSHLLTDELLFESESAAVKAAADIYNPISIDEDREFMGTIVQKNGAYYFTVTAGNIGDDTVSIRVPKSIWDDVVAFWHTHGGKAYHHRYFSEVDTAMVENLGRPFYLADYTGQLKVFRPGDRVMSKSQAVKLGLPKQAGYAKGGPVIDESARPIMVKT